MESEFFLAWYLRVKIYRFLICFFVLTSYYIHFQKEKYDDHGYQVKPSGFNLKFLPFSDDIRKLKVEEAPKGYHFLFKTILLVFCLTSFFAILHIGTDFEKLFNDDIFINMTYFRCTRAVSIVSSVLKSTEILEVWNEWRVGKV